MKLNTKRINYAHGANSRASLICYENDLAIRRAIHILLNTWRLQQTSKGFEKVYEEKCIGSGSASKVYRHQNVVAKVFYHVRDFMHVQMDDIYILPSIDHIPIYPKCYGFLPNTMLFAEYIEGELLETYEESIPLEKWHFFFHALLDTVKRGFMPIDLYSFNIIVGVKGLYVVDVGAFQLIHKKKNRILLPAFLKEDDDLPFLEEVTECFFDVVKKRNFQVIEDVNEL